MLNRVVLMVLILVVWLLCLRPVEACSASGAGIFARMKERRMARQESRQVAREARSMNMAMAGMNRNNLMSMSTTTTTTITRSSSNNRSTSSNNPWAAPVKAPVKKNAAW